MKKKIIMIAVAVLLVVIVGFASVGAKYFYDFANRKTADSSAVFYVKK